MIKRLQHALIQLLFWALITVAISVNLLRLTLAESNFFRTTLENSLSQHIGQKISIEHMSGALNGFKPRLALYNVKFYSPHTPLPELQFKEIRLGLHLFNALQHSLITALQVSIVGAQLTIKRLPSGKITLQGFSSNNSQQPTWLMFGNQYRLIDSTILWHDEQHHASLIQLNHVDMTLANVGQQHHLSVSALLPELWGQSFDLKMRFTGTPFLPETLNGQMFVQGKNIQLAQLMIDNPPDDINISQGQGNISLWSDWKASKITNMSGSAVINDAKLSSEYISSFAINHLDFTFKLQKHPHQWKLALNDISLNSQEIDLAIPSFAIGLIGKTKNKQHFAFSCPHLDLTQLSAILLANEFLAPNTQENLRALALKAQAENLLLVTNPEDKKFAFSGQLHQIHTQVVQQIPSIKGLSLFFKGSETQGEMQLASSKLSLLSPQHFRAPLQFKHLLGKLYWQQGTDLWTLNSPFLTLETEHFKLNNAFQLTFPKNNISAISMNVRSAIENFQDIANLQHYLPAHLIHSDTFINWFDQAFRSGSMSRGNLVFRGKLRDYPFVNNEGVSEAILHADNVDFSYAHHWPSAKKLQADIRFFSDSLAVNIYQGSIHQATIDQAAVTVDSFTQHTPVTINAHIHGALDQVVGFLSHSPLQDKMAQLNQQLNMQGKFSADLDLEIPLIPSQTPQIKITAFPHDAQVKMAKISLPITKINGTVHITDTSIISDPLTAHMLSFPLEATLDSTLSRTTLELFGQANIQHLAEQYPHQLWKQLDGTSFYQARVIIPHHSEDHTTFQLITDLEGMAINLPFLIKPKKEARPFSLYAGLDDSGINMLSINCEDHLVPKNSLDIKLKKSLATSRWQGLIHSPIASGSVLIPIKFNAQSKIGLFLDTLDLSTLKNIPPQNNHSIFNAIDLPSIHIESHTTYWQGYDLGKLSLVTSPSSSGLKINKFQIISKLDQLMLSGHWHQNKDHNTTDITGNLLSKNFGKLLKNLTISENIVNTVADIDFSFSWSDSPHHLSKDTLNGTIIPHLTQGRFLGINPGLGRVLGALDTQKLFQRLRFDFSDITQKGLSFSEITANIFMNQGLASTQNFEINAMPAKINLIGSTHLASETIDLRATVLPKLPIAGTIIGHVSNAVSESLSGHQHAGGLIVSLLYKIKGTWENFSVNRQYSPAFPQSIKKESSTSHQ